MELVISDIVRATGGRYVGDESAQKRIVTGLTWDSRELFPDNVFLAMPGLRVDGNDFIRSAVGKGAGLIICTRMPSDNVRAVAGEFDCPLLVVDDGIEALERIAGLWRDKLRALVIGVTGSTGKTSTKDFLRSVFSQRFKTVATQGNQNNEIGVPATILSADLDTEILIVEMGMRGLHQIEYLCSFAKPGAAVITNIGVSHMELLGTRENIARAKAELLAALPPTGFAILNADDEFTPMLERFGAVEEHGVAVRTYGLAKDASLHAENITFNEDACAFFDVVQGDEVIASVELAIPGEHNVLNALAAFTAGRSMDVSVDDIVRGLEETHPSAMRMEVLHTDNGITVINDAYNANPDSMRASLATLGTLKGTGRRIAVLGDMGELGPDEYQLHVGVGSYAAQAGLDLLVCVGTLGMGIKAGALAADMDAANVKSFTDADDATAFLEKYVQPGDMVLVKASRFMELERIVKGITRND